MWEEHVAVIDNQKFTINQLLEDCSEVKDCEMSLCSYQRYMSFNTLILLRFCLTLSFKVPIKNRQRWPCLGNTENACVSSGGT